MTVGVDDAEGVDDGVGDSVVHVDALRRNPDGQVHVRFTPSPLETKFGPQVHVVWPVDEEAKAGQGAHCSAAMVALLVAK